jgi:hypothetical protein
MKGERKLRLVTGGAKPPEDQDPREPGPVDEGQPFSAEEIASAAALRGALERGDDLLAAALGAAHAPRPIEPADLDAIVDRALGDDTATTAAERAAAESLRLALEAGHASEHREADHDGGHTPKPPLTAVLAIALRAAVHPAPIEAGRHEALVEAALHRPLHRRLPAVRRIAPVTMAALAGVAAMAAGVALFVGQAAKPRQTEGAATAALVRARSADDLFDAATPFPRRGEESARMDRIASARAADLRRNRFASWGVK